MKLELAPKSTEVKLTWDEAMLYCRLLEVDGKCDWHLPTKKELNEIYESDNDFEKELYWSSTESYDGNAWFQFFGNGDHSHLNKRRSYYVRAVRSL